MKTIICGIPFAIIEAEDGLAENPKFGQCDGMRAEIKINKVCSEEQKEATLVHEWIHGVFMCNGVAHNEDVVAVLATELYRNGFRVKVEP